MTETQTLAYAEKYLKRTYGGKWTLEVASSKYFWNRDTPLREVLAKSDSGHDGYLLVSTSEQTPFLITKAFHGGSLTNLLLKKAGALVDNSTFSKSFVSSAEFYYDPPFNFIIRDKAGLFIDISNNVALTNLDATFYSNLPKRNGEEIRSEWADLEDNAGVSALKTIEHRSGPRYNQAYNSGCEISGCTPVGWACYAGWLKMSGYLPTLFNGSSDWFYDWPTYIFKCETAEEQSKSVHELIWWLNKVLGTKNGSTPYSNVVKGAALFAKFGNPKITVKEFRDCSIKTVTSLLGNYAILFGGYRDWQVTNLASPELQDLYASEAGHSVVCHGVRGNEILVNMGWGDYVESRWYNINSIANRHCFGLYGSA